MVVNIINELKSVSGLRFFQKLDINQFLGWFIYDYHDYCS